MNGFEFFNILMAKDLAEQEEKTSSIFDDDEDKDDDNDMWDWSKKSW